MQQPILSPAPPSIDTEDFSSILQYHNLEYKPADQYYLQVGEITQVQGWILHVSVIKPQLYKLLTVLIPELVIEKVPFKVIYHADVATLLLTGQLGYPLVGKVVRIYPENEARALYLAQKLIALTTSFRGPEIPTDVHLGGTVYTRYGSFNPMMQRNTLGQAERYIYDAKGNAVKDEYHLPFKMPAGIAWPFASIAAPTPAKINGYLSVLNDSHIVTSVIKGDSKGNVFHTLRMKGMWFQWCLVKEAKRDTAVDDTERDVQERLHWQYKLQNELQHDLPVPKPYELFHENGNTYLVMEYVKGPSLYEVTQSIYENNSWIDLPLSKKLRLLDHLLQLIGYMEVLHSKGYVHRDFIPENFILDKRKRLVMIDMELAYNIHENYPDPPFALGTIGFMSPEQLHVQKPTVKEDIYGMGAMMIALLTNLLPEKFGTGAPAQREENLAFFIGHKTIAALITQCLQPMPLARPELATIKTAVQHYRATLADQTETSAPVYARPDADKVKKIIDDSIRSLNSMTLAGPERLWFSNSIESEQSIANQQNIHHHYMGLYAGISGVLYMLALAKRTGADVAQVTAMIDRACKYLHYKFIPALPNIPPGLYFGAAGLATALARALHNGLLADATDNTQNIIRTCLQIPCSTPDVVTGFAGQGLAVLHCLPFLKSTEATHLLQQQVNALLKAQQADGSWITNGEKHTGLSQGTAGIALFLMEYYSLYNDNTVKNAVEKALQWLQTKAIKQKNSFTWFMSNKQRAESPWLKDGYTGVALCFIRAYELFQLPTYRQLAEGALLNHPPHIICSNLSLAEGMSGIGEVYLEAARVFNNEVWQQRADWIAQVLTRTACYQEDGSCYWIMENIIASTADLMVGNSGVIHFLMRYNTPEKLSFPLLNKVV